MNVTGKRIKTTAAIVAHNKNCRYLIKSNNYYYYCYSFNCNEQKICKWIKIIMKQVEK